MKWVSERNSGVSDMELQEASALLEMCMNWIYVLRMQVEMRSWGIQVWRSNTHISTHLFEKKDLFIELTLVSLYKLVLDSYPLLGRVIAE